MLESHCRCQSGLSGAYRFDINRSMRCMSIPYTQNRTSTGCVTWWNVCVQSNYVQYQAMNLPTVQMDLQLSSTVPLMLSWTTVSYKQLFSSYWHTSCQGSRKKRGSSERRKAGVGRLNLGEDDCNEYRKERRKRFRYLWIHLLPNTLQKCSPNRLALATSWQLYLRFVVTAETTACPAPLNRATSQSPLRWKREVWWR